MGEAVRIWGCAFYLLLISFDGFLLRNRAESQSVDRLRPAEAACKKYRKIATDLGLTKVRSSEGYVPNLGEFPYLAAIGYLRLLPNGVGTLTYWALAVLISEKHLLTTASAGRTAFSKMPVEVVLGAMDPINTTQPVETQRVRIWRIIRYPTYDRRFYYGNIAILEFENPVKFTTYIQPVCLMTEPLTNRVEGMNTSMIIASWSESFWEIDGRPITQVKIKELEFVDKTECSNFYDAKTPRLPNVLDDDMFCLRQTASPNVGRSDLCHVQDASPVLIPFNDSYLLTGITFLYSSCHIKLPTVTLSTYQYLDWIEEHVWPDLAR